MGIPRKQAVNSRGMGGRWGIRFSKTGHRFKEFTERGGEYYFVEANKADDGAGKGWLGRGKGVGKILYVERKHSRK